MHIMQALVGCQKRSTKSLTRSLHPIDGVGWHARALEGQRHATSSDARRRDLGRVQLGPSSVRSGSAAMKVEKDRARAAGRARRGRGAGWFSLDKETRGLLATLPTNRDLLFWSQPQRDAAFPRARSAAGAGQVARRAGRRQAVAAAAGPAAEAAAGRRRLHGGPAQRRAAGRARRQAAPGALRPGLRRQRALDQLLGRQVDHLDAGRRGRSATATSAAWTTRSATTSRR